jgi:uncharacterized membrane protein
MPAADQQQSSRGAPSDPGMSHVVQRNVRALAEVRAKEEQRKGVSARVADGVTAFAGSMWFVYLHAIWFGGWIIVNCGWVATVRPFDPFPFVMLAMIASVEAIFLSTFILISQNRMQRAADRRAELDLQINLLAEHELTRAIHILDAIARKLEVSVDSTHELQDIKKDVFPERVIEEIQRVDQDHPGNTDGADNSVGLSGS